MVTTIERVFKKCIRTTLNSFKTSFSYTVVLFNLSFKVFATEKYSSLPSAHLEPAPSRGHGDVLSLAGRPPPAAAILAVAGRDSAIIKDT